MSKPNIKTEKQYLETIEKLHKNLTIENAEQTNKILDDLYNFKPVRLEWFYAKTDTLLELNEDVENYKNLLYTHYWTLKESDKFYKLAENLIKINEKTGNTLEVQRLNFELYTKSESSTPDKHSYYEHFFDDFVSLILKYIEDKTTVDDIKKIVDLAYISNDFTLAVIFENLYTALTNKKMDDNEIILSRPNIFYLKQILKSNSHTFTIVFDANNELIILAIIKALKYLNHKIFVLLEPQNFDVEVAINISETLDVSLETLQENDDFHSFIPVQIIKNGQLLGDNRLQLINYISNNLTNENLSTVLAYSDYMLNATKEVGSNRLLEPLYQDNTFCNTLSFGWSGDYCAFMDKLYNTDSKKLLNEKPTLDFSLIIPVRNDSSNTLFHTLKTCLNIDYKGKFEIIVSDNSEKGNTKVKMVVDKLNDKRIKYYKPPFELYLSKSFEFACLMAKGNFLIPFGGDDAILPNALNVISNVMSQYPEKDFILWKRGFYAWPGFNGTQQHQFSIPIETATSYQCTEIQSNEFWVNVLKQPQLMYTLPLFYINSGFKKSYLNKLLLETGSLFNGPCQDIYTGIVNISINKSILYLDKQLTFAGMSSSSIGGNDNTAKISVPKAKKLSEYTNIYIESYYESLIPTIWSDRGTLYKSILRAISKGVAPQSFLDNIIDFENFYKNMLLFMKKNDIMFERDMELFKISAQKINDNFYEWFENSYYKNNFEPVYIDTMPQHQERSYNTGFTEKNLTLDASDFGVENIYDAVGLYKKITGI